MQTLRSMPIIGGTLAVLLSLTGLAVSRTIVAPITRLTKGAEKVAAGDFTDMPKGVNVPFIGEMSMLHKSMISMVEQLGSFIDAAGHKTKEAEHALAQNRKALTEAEEAWQMADHARREGVLQTASRLEDAAGDLNQAGVALEKKAILVSRAVDTQLARTTETATAMNQMNGAVLEVAAPPPTRQNRPTAPARNPCRAGTG